MANFDILPPDVNAPDWAKESRAIPQPESITKADTSLGTTLTTIGEGLTGALTVGERIQEGVQKEAVRSGVENLRDNYTAALIKVRDQQMAGLVPDPKSMAAAGVATGTLSPDEQAEVPGGLQAGLDKASALGTAMAQNGGGGKANDTLYTGALNALAKNLRNQYPGSVDFIDQEIAKVSGKNPANAFYENLLTDINRNAASAQSERNKVTTLVRDHLKFPATGDFPNGAVMGSLWDAGRLTPAQVYTWINKVDGHDYARKSEMEDRTNLQGRQTDKVTQVTQDWAKNASNVADSAIHLTQMANGTDTLQGMIDLVQKANAEGAKVDPVRLEQGIQGAYALLANTEATLWRQARVPDRNGDTTESIIGPAAVKLHIDAQLAPIQSYIKYLDDEKHGFAHTALRQATAIKDTAQRDLLTDKTVGPPLAKIAALNGIAPTWGDTFQKAGLLVNLDKSLINVFQNKALDAVTQTDPLKPATIKKDFVDAKNQGVSASTRLFDNYLNVPKVIADPTAPDAVKLNVAKYAFDPKNWGLMDEIKMDYVNQKGVPVPGKYSAFDRMFSTDIIQNMDKLRKQGGEGKVAWDNMKKMGENEFPALFREDLHNIVRAGEMYKNQMQTTTTPLEAAPGQAPKFDMHWDSTNNRFLELPIKGRSFGGQGADTTDNQFAASTNVIIRRVNSALSQLDEMNKKDGTSTSAYVVKLLKDSDPQLAPILDPMKKAFLSAYSPHLKRLEDTVAK